MMLINPSSMHNDDTVEYVSAVNQLPALRSCKKSVEKSIGLCYHIHAWPRINTVFKRWHRMARKIIKRIWHSFGKTVILQIYTRFRYCYCPCCDSYFKSFAPFPYWERPELYNPARYLNADNLVICPNCESSPRHRILVYWMQKHHDDFEGKRILHFAQEPCIRLWLRRNKIASKSADLYSKADVKMDIEDTGLADSSESVIICNHVLEHVKDYKRALRELHRILKDDGMILLSVPIDPSFNDVYEDLSILSDNGRREAFGQADHLRVFGNNTKELFESYNFDITVVNGDSMPKKIKPVVGAADYNANWFYVMKKRHL